MQPADTALTRVYNQPTVVEPDGRLRGTLYRNPIDCLWKTFKTEGVRGWYKGSFLCRAIFSKDFMKFCRFNSTFPAYCSAHVGLHLSACRIPFISMTFQHHHFDHERHHHKSVQDTEGSGVVVAVTAAF